MALLLADVPPRNREFVRELFHFFGKHDVRQEEVHDGLDFTEVGEEP